MLHGSSSAGEEQGAVQNEEKREGAESLSKVIDGIKKGLAAIPKMAQEKWLGIFVIRQHGCGEYQPERMLQKK